MPQLAASPEAFVLLRSRFAKSLGTLNTVMYLMGAVPARDRPQLWAQRARCRDCGGADNDGQRTAAQSARGGWGSWHAGIGDRHLDNFLLHEHTCAVACQRGVGVKARLQSVLTLRARRCHGMSTVRSPGAS